MLFLRGRRRLRYRLFFSHYSQRAGRFQRDTNKHGTRERSQESLQHLNIIVEMHSHASATHTVHLPLVCVYKYTVGE